ncbi:uncharacterized protein LOC100366475 [Saccoglossus kowalevskii]|uniref:Uncharacterized protein LOC100366475 n=1 Tax=Saccoglossus kowalevskii TaxID=10224 RepID=A0ABM0GWR1_SACKO|nr:PREDICTED: uncharacterized protein LOC100366475 [Saccoglossus kowalevskii]
MCSQSSRIMDRKIVLFFVVLASLQSFGTALNCYSCWSGEEFEYSSSDSSDDNPTDGLGLILSDASSSASSVALTDVCLPHNFDPALATEYEATCLYDNPICMTVSVSTGGMVTDIWRTCYKKNICEYGCLRDHVTGAEVCYSCCEGDLCNTDSGSNAVVTSFSLILAASFLGIYNIH